MSSETDIWLERLTSLRASMMRKAATSEGLQFIHAEILEYLAKCNRYSNTAQALTEYLGLTKGSVSQSLKLLEGKGLVARTACPDDKRISRLSLTEEGQRMLNSLLKHVPVLETKPGTVDNLKGILTEFQLQHGLQGFGLCRTCSHHQVLKRNSFRCGLTNETLSLNDSEKICRDHIFET